MLREDQGKAPQTTKVAGPAAGSHLEVRLAVDEAEVRAAQRLRYHVFYQEMNAEPTPQMAAAEIDFDRFDPICEHVLVIDNARAAGDRVVGTYRLLSQAVAEQHGGFYSAGEYDLTAILERGRAIGGLLELGRSCVRREYRANATIHLLWRGIANYVREHRVTTMFGCASLPGRDPWQLAEQLSYLHHFHKAPAETTVRALPHLHKRMDLMPAERVRRREALQALPPLIKAYLRLGGCVGDGAVVDEQFGTTDVFMMVLLERVRDKYFTHFDRDGEIAATRDSLKS